MSARLAACVLNNTAWVRNHIQIVLSRSFKFDLIQKKETPKEQTRRILRGVHHSPQIYLSWTTVQHCARTLLKSKMASVLIHAQEEILVLMLTQRLTFYTILWSIKLSCVLEVGKTLIDHWASSKLNRYNTIREVVTLTYFLYAHMHTQTRRLGPHRKSLTIAAFCQCPR